MDGGTVFFVWSQRPHKEDKKVVVFTDLNPDMRRIAMKEIIAARELEFKREKIDVWLASKDKRIAWIYK